MATNPPHICVVGSCNIDLTFRAARLPRPGETIPARSFQLGYGGKGANQAAMAARLGARVSLIARVGKDLFGEGTLQNLRDQGIDTAHVTFDETQSTGTASIVVDDQAQNCILVAAGANAALSPADIQHAAGAIRESQVLLCQLEVPIATTLEALRIARSAGVKTILNPAPAALLPDDLLGLADLCIPNETEIEELTGIEVQDLAQAEGAAHHLLKRGPGTIIITLGSRGALIVDADPAQAIPAFAVEAIDPTGAGDAFIGSLAVFLAQGGQLAESARRASAAAALAVTRPGAQAAFPTRAEFDNFWETHHPSH